MKKVTLITDGACLGNPGPGGWAVLLRYNNHQKILSGGESSTTNNRMELTAVIMGLKALKERCEVLIRADSQYIINAIEQGWLEKWKFNGWKTSGKDPVKNQDLWEELDELLSQQRVKWDWVKGHSGDPDNEMVDETARQEAKNFTRG